VDNFVDTNNNGLNDANEPLLGGVALPIPDTDSDGTPDFLDTDSDNDGVSDANEILGAIDVDGDGINDDSADLNGDGVADSCHPATGVPIEFLDSDGDGIPNHLDSTNSGNGCSLSSPRSVNFSMPLFLLIPAVIMICRLWRRRKATA